MRLLILTLTIAAIGCSHQQQASEIPPSEPNKPQSGYAQVNGLKMYYEIHGQGQPLVLIHGGGSTIESNFSRFIPQLAKTRRVIAVEEQSHGHTPNIQRPFTFENTADDVAALLDFLKIERADLF